MSKLPQRVLVMDGAMGTMNSSTQKDALNLTAPEVIQSIHRQYLEAGADILKTKQPQRGYRRAAIVLQISALTGCT